MQKHIFLNVALHTELPSHLAQYLNSTDQSKINEWALEELRRLIDGEETEGEFGAELLALQIKNPPNRGRAAK